MKALAYVLGVLTGLAVVAAIAWRWPLSLHRTIDRVHNWLDRRTP